MKKQNFKICIKCGSKFRCAAGENCVAWTEDRCYCEKCMSYQHSIDAGSLCKNIDIEEKVRVIYT